jgi:hypothetical protein
MGGSSVARAMSERARRIMKSDSIKLISPM